MKSLFRIIVLIIITFTVTQPASGQKWLKNLKEKAQQKVEEKIEERAEKKLDEKIDEELDKVEESLEKKENDSENEDNTEVNSNENNDEERLNSLLKGFGISGDPIPIEDSYSFSTLIKMHVSTTDNNGKKTSDGDFITHFDTKSKNMAYQVVSGDIGTKGKGFFIFDVKNEASIFLSEENGEKKGLVYGMKNFMTGETFEGIDDSELENTPESYLANPNVSKTGRKKTIAGYKCEEYKYTNEEAVSHIWITKDLKFNTGDFMSAMIKSSAYSQGMPWGYMMESESKNTNTGETSVMKVTEVNENANVKVKLADYQVTNFGNMNVPGE